MTEPLYIESSFGARVKLIGASLAVIVFGMAYDHWVAPWTHWIATLPTCASLPWVRLELTVAVVVCWFMAWAAFKQSEATRKLGQTPLPGTWVWSRTRVRTGTYAAFTSAGFLVLGALFLVGPVVVIVWQELYVIFCIPESCGC